MSCVEKNVRIGPGLRRIGATYLSHYDLSIGIDYSGAQAPTSTLKALQVRLRQRVAEVAQGARLLRIATRS